MDDIIQKFISLLNKALVTGKMAQIAPRYRNSLKEANELREAMEKDATINWFAAKALYTEHKETIDNNIKDLNSTTVKAALDVINKELTEQIEQILG